MDYRTLMPIFDELVGERIVIRPYQLADAEAVQAAIAESRDALRPWLPFADQHQSGDETRDFIIRSQAQWLLRDNFNASLWERDSARFLGGIGFHPRDWAVPSFEIGYWLRSTAAGNGSMTEAVRLLTAALFTTLGAQRVEIHCDARNARSAAVPQRLGFVQEACLRNDGRAADGTLRSTLIFALTPDDPR